MKQQLILIYCLFFFCFSCSKENDPDGTAGQHGDGTSITFEISGIDNGTQVVDVNREQISKIHAASHSPQSILYKKQEPVNEFCDAVVSLSEVPTNAQTSKKVLSAIGSRSTGEHGVKLSSTDMPIGRTYRVVLYEGGTQVATLNATSGTAFTFSGAFRNRVYTWFAYSYNNSVPFTGNFDDANPNISLSGNSGLLYASGTITTSNTLNYNNKLNILFKEKSAIIELVVDARGMFGTIGDIQVSNMTTGQLKNGVLNLRTGNFVSYSNAPLVNRSNSDFVNHNTALSDQVRRTNFYTVDAQNQISNFKVNISTLTLRGDLYPEWGDPIVFTNREFTVATPFTPQHNKRYRVTITLIMTPKTIGSGTSRTEWARGNLYVKGSGTPSAEYRMRFHAASNAYGIVASGSTSEAKGEYLNWRALSSGATAASSGTNDPCALVYPAGRWKMPTNTDITRLSSHSSRQFRHYGGRETIRLLRFNFSGSDNPYDPENRLSFPLYGYRNVNSYAVTGYNISSSGTAYGYYWSGDQSSSTNAYMLSIVSSGSTSGNFSLSNMAKNRGANIKCVRDLNWTSAQLPALPAADY